MISDWWICVIPVVLITLALMCFAQRSYKPQGDHDPVILDATGPHRRDQEKIIEAGSIIEQRRSGRERGGRVILIIAREPSDYSAQLNLRSLQEHQKNGNPNIQIRRIEP